MMALFFNAFSCVGSISSALPKSVLAPIKSSILDTNCDPDLVDIPIPGNDDAVRSIKLILKSLTDSIIKGKSELN